MLTWSRTAVAMGRIQEFFAFKTVLVTGATGFLGGVLLERLLSSCPDLEEVFVVARPRKGQTPIQRLQSLLSLPLFDNLEEDAKKKVRLLTGDVTMPNMGLSWTDMEKIKERVHVVFHMAAIVNFGVALDKAVITNVGGTAAVLSLAKEMLNLQAFVYVSTAYCNCTAESLVEEKIYPCRWDPVELLREVMESPSNDINRRTKEFLVDHPNTYSFSKQLAENLIALESGDLPIAIVRPSIVMNTAERPVKGWTYNVMSGAFAFIAGAGRGAFRTIFADGNAVVDLVPSDYFTAFLLATACRTAIRRDFQVYHYTSGTVRPIIWSEYVSSAIKYLNEYPTKTVIIPPRAHCRKNYLHNLFVLVVFQYIPALFLDFFGLPGDAPFRMWDIQEKFNRGMNYASYFTLNQWWFSTEKQVEVWNEMDEEDKKEFWFNLENFNWDSYIKICVLGVRRYFHNQDDSNMERARSLYTKRKRIYYCAWITTFFVIFLFLQFFIWITISSVISFASITVSSVISVAIVLFLYWV